MWKRLDIKGKILIPLCSGIFLVIAVLMAVGFSMLQSEKNFAGQLRNDFIVSLYDIAASDRMVQMEKAANILINTDEVVAYLEDQNASESVKMVLDGVLLSIGENNDIRRFALYDQNYTLVSEHSEPGVPTLPRNLDPAHRGPFEMCAQEYDFRTFQRSIENSGQVELEICLVTVVTDMDDEVIGFVEVATKPAAFAANIQERTGSQNAFLSKGVTSFACATESELFSSIAKTLDSGSNDQESARGKAGQMHFLADKVPVLAADRSILGEVWVVNDDSANVKAQNKTLLIGGTVVLVTAIGIILFLMLLLRNSIVKPLDSVMTRVSGASSQVSSASYQIASTSSQLAGNSTEQAASLEETSASLLDLSSKTTQNSKSTHQADSLMTETQSRVAHGREATQSMIETINSIKTSSDETSKIISTINEIAFQTNLLALNAAVEAARAGDYGRGFAVVAEEVGNLAKRSQQAAQSTAQIIDEARAKADNGVVVVHQVSEGLDAIQESTETCGSLIAEIAEATGDQSLVIEQLNQAMSDINLVVQQGAANAEESASTSEELSGQASKLDFLVEEMSCVIKGSQD